MELVDSSYDAEQFQDSISNSIQSFEKLPQKSLTPISTRSHILIVSKSPQDPPNRKSNRNLLIMMRMFESLRYKYTIHHIKGGKFPSLTETKEPNHGRFSLLIFDSTKAFYELKELHQVELEKYHEKFNSGQIILSDEESTLLIYQNRKTSKTSVRELKSTVTIYQTAEIPRPENRCTKVYNKISLIKLSENQILKRGAEIAGFSIGSRKNLWHPGDSEKIDTQRDSCDFEMLAVTRGQNLRMNVGDEDEVGGEEWNTYVSDGNEENLVIYNRKLKTSLISIKLSSWVGKTALIDLICYLGNTKTLKTTHFNPISEFQPEKPEISQKQFNFPLERYIQIDIDDCFVGIGKTRTSPIDVEKTIKFQKLWREKIKNFRFMVGFSGKFYKTANTEALSEEKQQGDNSWLKNASKFYWFDHMWSHMQAHWFETADELYNYMKQGKQFADRWKLKVGHGYSVAPHHSGVYPVHKPLYDVWKRLYGVNVTSTEEYPHLKDFLHRGFVYEGVRVLPRQTCDIYTKTYIYSDRPGLDEKLKEGIFPSGHFESGPEHFENITHGGSLFETILLNKYNVYMTHLQNYANDQLSLRLFGTVFNFILKHTNMNLRQLEPSKLADKYFESYKDEKELLLTNPCDDKRHLEIIATNADNRRELFDVKSVLERRQQIPDCVFMSDIVVLGGGVGDLDSFGGLLKKHPMFMSVETRGPSFFDDDAEYAKGWERYNDQFLKKSDSDFWGSFSAGKDVKFPVGLSSKFIFEKSTNYFHSSQKTISRLNSMLPHAVIALIITNPTKLAFSIYQNLLISKDPAASNISFHELITIQNTVQNTVQNTIQNKLQNTLQNDLRHTCLSPGKYTEHLKKWNKPDLNFVLAVDGESFETDPGPVLNSFLLSIQKLFQMKNKKYIRNRREIDGMDVDFFETTVLDVGRAVDYSLMSVKTKNYLDNYYSKHNEELKLWLEKRRYAIPEWLAKKYN